MQRLRRKETRCKLNPCTWRQIHVARRSGGKERRAAIMRAFTELAATDGFTNMSLENVTIFCFGASYFVAFMLELLALVRPGRLQRILGIAFAVAGIFAHTIFI